MSNQTELRAAETLLERGLKVQINAPLLLRALGKKQITLTLYQPNYGTLLRVSRHYLKSGCADADLVATTTVQNALGLMSTSGVEISKALACAILNGWLLGWLFTYVLAWQLRESLKPTTIFALAQLVLIHGGVADFMSTTRSVAMLKVTTPNLGQKTKGS